jgi:hypothetical protein
MLYFLYWISRVVGQVEKSVTWIADTKGDDIIHLYVVSPGNLKRLVAVS